MATKRASKGSKAAKKSTKKSGQEPAPGEVGSTPAFKVDKPWDVCEENRYSVSNDGIYHMWVRNTDQPFKFPKPGEHVTLPRTEQRFKLNYTSGQVQYEAELMVPSLKQSKLEPTLESNGMSIMQIHTATGYIPPPTPKDPHPKPCSTAFMLFWYSLDGGSVHHYEDKRLASKLTGQWFHLKVLHDLTQPNHHTVTVWINKTQVWQGLDKLCSQGAPSYYIKNGVYAQNYASPIMEVNIKNIQITQQ